MTLGFIQSGSQHLRLALLAGGVCLASAAFAQTPAPKNTQQAPRPAAPAAAPPAAAAPAPAAAPAGPTLVNLKADPSQEWVKVCGEDPGAKKTICYTTRDFLAAENNQPIMAAAVYDVQNDPKKFVRFLLPLTFMIQPGIRFTVDANQPVAGKFQICFPNGCFAEAEVTEAFINTMKKGANLKIDAQNNQGREISFMMPLTGFQKSFDGPAIDPKVLQEQQQRLEAELQKKAEEMRKQGGEAPKQ